jgi:hypothetical protein
MTGAHARVFRVFTPSTAVSITMSRIRAGVPAPRGHNYTDICAGLPNCPALTDYLSTFDELHELRAPPLDQDFSGEGGPFGMRRSSAVSGTSVFALD